MWHVHFGRGGRAHLLRTMRQGLPSALSLAATSRGARRHVGVRAVRELHPLRRARHPRASWSPRADVCAPCLREERADRTRCAFASCGRACIAQVDLTAARRDVATVTDVNMILVCNACGVRFHFQCALREDAIPQSAADEQEPLIFCPRCCMPPQRPADSALLAIDSEPAAPGGDGAADASTAEARATDVAEAEAVHDITSFERPQ